MSLFPQPPKSLCILRLSAIGDVCHALAVVQQIQQYYPQTQITWIIGKAEAQLMQGLPNVELVPYDKKTGWKGVLVLWKSLKGRKFDALLNMQTALRASMLSLGIKAQYKIGFGKQRAREGQWLFTNVKVQDPANPHVLDGLQAFAQAIGVPAQAPHWQLPLSSENYAKVRPFLQENKKHLLIAPCSSKAEKDWLPERYASLADYAYQQGFQVLVCGSPAPREMQMAQKICELCQFEPLNLAGKTSLKELAALIGLVDLVVASDSGPAHIATCQGTPVIGLYAYHNPARTGPYLNLDQVVSVYEKNLAQEFGKPAEQLPWATKLKGKNLMAQIEVEDVIKKMQDFL